MRIVFDLDGVICQLKNPDEPYSKVKPNKKIINYIKKLKKRGFYIIISTARHMRSTNGNPYKAVAKIGKETLDWLSKWSISYDEIHFGKPYGDIYIDDMNLVYTSPEKLEKDIDLLQPIFVIPMAGRGQRFINAGYNIPKYMIEAGNKKIFEWALESLPLDIAKNIIFVCLEEHEKKYRVSKFIRKTIQKKYHYLKDKYIIIFLKKITRGQVETVLKAKRYINNQNHLIIYNIDTYFRSSRLRQKILSARNQNIDGIFSVFKSNNPKWSFAKVNKNYVIEKTAEKKPISNLASVGLYTFTEGKMFVEVAKYMIKKKIMFKGEFYVAPLYNILIKKKKKFIVDLVEEFWCFGTPEDLDFFNKNYYKTHLCH